MKFIEVTPIDINHSIYPKHYHSKKRIISHNYKKCVKDANNDEEKKKICIDNRIKYLQNEILNIESNNGSNSPIKFLLNGLKVLTGGNFFEIIYYLFGFFTVLFIISILLLIFWYLIKFFDRFTIKRLWWNYFPGPYVMIPLDIYFKRIHIFIIFFALIGAMIFLGPVILFYLCKKLLGWFPASLLWDILGIFKGSEVPFKWIDSVIGCFFSGGPLLCNQQATWNLVEDWIVYTCKKDRSACKNRSDDEIREALNSIKNINIDIGHSHNNNNNNNNNNNKYSETTEGFTDFNNNIELFQNSPLFKKQLFNYIEKFNLIDEYKYKIYDNLIYQKNKIDTTGREADEEKKLNDEKLKNCESNNNN
jgi:hypothetical protein